MQILDCASVISVADTIRRPLAESLNSVKLNELTDQCRYIVLFLLDILFLYWVLSFRLYPYCDGCNKTMHKFDLHTKRH